jgi:hypothetical protein
MWVGINLLILEWEIKTRCKEVIGYKKKIIWRIDVLLNKLYNFQFYLCFHNLFCQMYNKYIVKLKILKFNSLNNCFDLLK